MVLNRQVIAGVVAGILISACAGVTFPYKYYTLSATYFDGSLLGPAPSDDLNLKICAPTATDKAPCTTMLTKDFLALKLDYLNKAADLIACQKGN